MLGTLDLRKFAEYLDPPSPKSLSALTFHYLGIQLNKITEVRCGDWDADTLTDEQISYAACDALTSVLVYEKVIKKQIYNVINHKFFMYCVSLHFRSKKEKERYICCGEM